MENSAREFNQIDALCADYKSKLLTHFEEKLKLKDSYAYNYYFRCNYTQAKPLIAEEIVEDLLNNHSLIQLDAELNHILEKYVIITDLQSTIKRDKKSIEARKEELIEKIIHHKSVLFKNWDQTDINFLQNISYRLEGTEFFKHLSGNFLGWRQLFHQFSLSAITPKFWSSPQPVAALSLFSPLKHNLTSAQEPFEEGSLTLLPSTPIGKRN